MKKKQFIIILTALFLGSGCEQNQVPENDITGNLFMLCEGNFGSTNADLWVSDLKTDSLTANVYKTLTGHELGDVAQSMYLNNGLLYIVNNNSHTVEVLSVDGSIEFQTTIPVPAAAPRFMAFSDSKAYVTTWNSGILIVELNTHTLTDTIPVDGMTEDILIHNGFAYVGVPMNSEWSTNNLVLKIDLTIPAVTDTFAVTPGPARMLLNHEILYIAGTYYNDYWIPSHGLSAVDLASGSVQTAEYGSAVFFGTDLVVINDHLYRSTNSGLLKINPDLTLDENDRIDDYSGVYAVKVLGELIAYGTTDYMAPDTVYITDLDHQLLFEFKVGAIPTDFVITE